MVVDLPPTAPPRRHRAAARPPRGVFRGGYAAYYHRHATADSPPMRGADPAIALVLGIGMFSFWRATIDGPRPASSTATPSW